MTSDITNTADVIDIRDIIERVEELRDRRKHVYVAGWNMPGYMPDSEPAEFDDADSAMEYIKEKAKDSAMEDADGMGWNEEDFQSAVNEIDAWKSDDNGEFGRTIGRFHYFINYQGIGGLDSDESEELETLESLLEELCGNGGDEQWEGNWYPVTLVRDSYFTEYAQQLADDIGAINSDATWPSNCIDWELAARELRMDYRAVEYGDVTYWYR